MREGGTDRQTDVSTWVKLNAPAAQLKKKVF